ncbi:MAG TPA: hypothetical protein VIY86_04950, partial [Pirellulaceae bacterium]
PTLTSSFQESIRRNPQTLVDVVFPIIGPAIRRSIKEALTGLVQSVNATLEQSLSWRGLQWRWEALRSGRSFGEVVLLKTLLYRVEHAFLIHAHDGLLLKHVTSLPHSRVHADMISGMLTAIQDFVRDSFGGSGSGGLKEVEVDDRTVWIEQGPKAMLALVISGHPPQELRELMQEVLESIHRDFAAELTRFSGDDAPFTAVSGSLERCLISATRDPKPRPGTARLAKLIAAGMLVGILALGGWFGWQVWCWREARQIANFHRYLRAPPTVKLFKKDKQLIAQGSAHRAWIEETKDLGPTLPGGRNLDLSGVQDLDEAWFRYLDSVRGIPGIVVTEARVVDHAYRLEGLRDPLADDPGPLLAAAGLSADQVRIHWRPFHSAAPEMLIRHALRWLAPPETVEVTETAGGLRCRGQAPHAWLADASRKAAVLADRVEIDLRGVEDLERLGIDRLAGRLNEYAFAFPSNSSDLTATESRKLDQAATLAVEAAKLAAASNMTLRILALGSVIPSETTSEEVFGLSYSRARAIRYHLLEQGVPREIIDAMSAHDALADDAPLGTAAATGWLRVRVADERG